MGCWGRGVAALLSERRRLALSAAIRSGFGDDDFLELQNEDDIKLSTNTNNECSVKPCTDIREICGVDQEAKSCW